MLIRRATVADVELLCRLSAPVQQVHHEAKPHLFKPAGTTPELMDDYRNRLSNETVYCFVGEVENEPVGYILAQVVERPDNPYAYPMRNLLVDQMSVNPEYRSKGYGENLMGRVFDLARSMGIDKVVLNVWAFNERAIGFYVKQGFAPRDIRMEAQVE